jgi:hypothetical protein
MTTRLTIRKPDDWHLHVRDGAMLKAVLPFTAKHFGRAILMPNLVPPVATTADAAGQPGDHHARKDAMGRPRGDQGRGPDERAILYRGGETIEWKVVAD